MTLSTVILASAVSLTLPLGAAASEITDANTSGWSSASTDIIYTGSYLKKEYLGDAMSLEAVYSGTAETTGNVAFTCYAGTFTASVALAPVSMRDMIVNTPQNTELKLKRLDMKIDGKTLRSPEWIYIPKLGVYRARKSSTAAKFYNSVIRQSSIEIKAGGNDYVPIKLPPVDRAFGNFGSECGMGTSAKKIIRKRPETISRR